MQKAILAWLRQPTSVVGASAILGTISALMTAQLSWAQAVPLLVGAVASIAFPDSSDAKASAESLAGAVMTQLTNTKDKNNV
jgi:hypothetical protein